MTATPIISALMCARNAELTVEAAIRSTLDTSVPIELVFVDDHSTDRTFEIVRSIKDSRLHILQATGIGVVDACNQALENATGEFVGRVDADDESIAGRYEAQLRAVEQDRLDVCSGIALVVDGDDQPLYRSLPFPLDSLAKLHLHIGAGRVNGSTIIRRSAMESIGGYDSGTAPAEDYDLWVRLASAGFRFGATLTPVYMYRLWDGNLTATKADEMRDRHVEIATRARESIDPGIDSAWDLLTERRRLRARSGADWPNLRASFRKTVRIYPPASSSGRGRLSRSCQLVSIGESISRRLGEH